jgi:hypothetical protein
MQKYKSHFLKSTPILVFLLIGSCKSPPTKISNYPTFFFIPIFQNKPLSLNKYYKTAEGDSLQFTTLRFYISNFTLLNKGQIAWSEPNSYHLIDLQIPYSQEIRPVNIPNKIEFSEIKFNLGIDSTTNQEGAKGGDLDPTKGMYWSWQSGYINTKIEGNSNKCQTRNHEFHFHLGGYEFPNNNLQQITLSKTQNNSLEIDIQKWIESIDLKILNNILSPSNEANRLAKNLAKNTKSR